jgi:hypothetical protein
LKFGEDRKGARQSKWVLCLLLHALPLIGYFHLLLIILFNKRNDQRRDPPREALGDAVSMCGGHSFLPTIGFRAGAPSGAAGQPWAEVPSAALERPSVF